MVHNIPRLQGEKKNGVVIIEHGRERDGNFLDNFTFRNKATFHNELTDRPHVGKKVPESSWWLVVP